MGYFPRVLRYPYGVVFRAYSSAALHLEPTLEPCPFVFHVSASARLSSAVGWLSVDADFSLPGALYS